MKKISITIGKNSGCHNFTKYETSNKSEAEKDNSL